MLREYFGKGTFKMYAAIATFAAKQLKQRIMKVQNHLDVAFLKSEVGTIVEYPDNSKEQVIFKTTDKVGNYYLTQIQTNNIKKNGKLGKLTSWLKFKHYELVQ